jgi:hypothetical protein
MDKGNDETKLGRWTWTGYRGVKGIQLSIINDCRLMSTSNKGGAETTHAQHMRALDRIGRTTEPIKVFDKDFFHFVTTSRVAEKQMVIMMDANANIRDSNFTKRMQSKGLTDHLSHKTKKIHQLLFQ